MLFVTKSGFKVLNDNQSVLFVYVFFKICLIDLIANLHLYDYNMSSLLRIMYLCWSDLLFLLTFFKDEFSQNYDEPMLLENLLTLCLIKTKV